MNDELVRLRRENAELRAQLEADPYQKFEELGSGGFCVVWRALRWIDDQHAIEVCIKELKPSLREDSDSLRYFRREAAIAANLRHSNIVRLRDVDFRRHRLVYELVDGVDLRRLMAHAGGKLATDFVVLIGLEVCTALDHAHSSTRQDAPAGVIHRDLTPGNVLIAMDGQVMLTDFGVAALESTQPQTSVGTKHYMSPEQAQGRPVDARTDLWSLGVVLYELLTGRRPFAADPDEAEGDGAVSLERLVKAEYPPLQTLAPHTPPALIAIITQLLMPARADRYKNAYDVFLALSALAPSHDVKRALGAIARTARRRKTKDLSTLQLSAARTAVGDSAVPRERPEDPVDSRVHNAITAVRPPAPESGHSWTTAVSTERHRRRVTAGALGAALGATLLAGAAAVWPMMSRPDSPSATERSAVAPAPLPMMAAQATPAETPPASGQAQLPSPSSEVAAAALPAAAPGDGSAHPADGSGAPATSTSTQRAAPIAKATIKVSADKSAPVLIDNKFVGWSPIPATAVEPGMHTVVIGAAGAQKTVRAQVAPGSTREIYVSLRHPKN